MITVPEPDYIGFLVERKFPALRKRPSEIARKYGYTDGIVYDDEPHPPASAEIQQQAEEYAQELSRLSQTEIKKLYREEYDKKNNEDDARRFFSQKKADADFDHWSRMPHWSVDEAIALSLGKDPREVYLGRMKSVMPYLSPFVYHYHQLHEIAARAVTVGQLANPIQPGAFIQWAKGVDLPVPDRLKELVASRGHDTADWKNLHDSLAEKTREIIAEQEAQITALNEELAKALAEKPLKTRERDTAYKLIIGMAVGGYGYNSKTKKNTTATDIASDIARLGLSVDQDTIRRWLKEAAELLPPEPDKI